MDIPNSYQTIPLPNGVIKGLFPTQDWFNAIDIDFKDKTVLDLGCCSFSFGVNAILQGASKVIGIDCEESKITNSKKVIAEWGFNNAEVYQERIETYHPEPVDIIIFSLIIHWLEDPEYHITRLTKDCTSVFIYRYPQEFKEKGYRPTLDELDKLMGCPHSYSKRLPNSDKHPDQNIMLVVYNAKT